MPRVTFKLFDEIERARQGKSKAVAGMIPSIVGDPKIITRPSAYCNLAMIKCLLPYGRASCRNKDGDFEILHLFDGDQERQLTLRHATDMDQYDGPAMSWEVEEEIPEGWEGFKIAFIGDKKKWWQFWRQS